MRQILNGKKITLGTCYYPEHWEKKDWIPDMRKMLECGIEVIRVAEFAWSKVEPEEGKYTYEFWDEFLDTAQECGMKVIFSTPTATPPAWLTDMYPEVLNADVNGVLYRHGNRQHANHTSEKFLEYCKNIVEKLAEHYGKHPAIIGWQLDNEFNCSLNVFYSESDTYAFRNFLKEKYGTVEQLNEAWGTVFWNQTYSSWREIYVPRKVPTNAVNPQQLLDYIRFVSDSTCRFAQMQAEIIKRYKKPDDFITTNGIFGNLDSHRLTKESLDFFTYDSYPNFAYSYDGENLKGLRDRKWSRNLSEVRSVSSIFGIMEQQAGAGGWTTRMESSAPRPGQMTLWTMQSIAHGADYVSFFRWRTSTIGTEIYWHGLQDYSGRDNRRIAELKELHKKIKLLNQVAGSHYQAKVGVLRDYDNDWDSQLDVWHGHVEKCSKDGIYEAAQWSHTPLDYVYLTGDDEWKKIKNYKVLFYPHAVILTKERAELLKKYVEEGGTLVLGCRTGYKDVHGKCVRSYLPGYAREMSGTDVLEYSFVAPDEAPVYTAWDGEKVEVSVFMDMLAPLGENARVLSRYENGMYSGEPALICNSLGKGQIYYFGGAFNKDVAALFLQRLEVNEPYRELIELPEECEIAVRENENGKYLFILNYSDHDVTIHLKRSMHHMFEQQEWTGKHALHKYEAIVLKCE